MSLEALLLLLLLLLLIAWSPCVASYERSERAIESRGRQKRPIRAPCTPGSVCAVFVIP